MNTECYPTPTLPGTTALFRDYAEAGASAHMAAIRRWYPSDPFAMEWAKSSPAQHEAHRARLADARDHSYFSASTGSSCAARVAGMVPKTTPTTMAEVRAMTTDQGVMGMAKSVKTRADTGGLGRR